MKYLYILIGSGTGGLVRYLFSKWIYGVFTVNFPIGTMAVNLSGCLIIGFLTGLFEYIIVSPDLRLFIFVGFLGGFTTFSTFCLETFNLLKEAEIKIASINMLLCNFLGIALVFAGYFLARLSINSMK